MSDTLSLSAGQSRACINTTVILDDILEGLEFLQVSISSDDPRVSVVPSASIAIVLLSDSTGK